MNIPEKYNWLSKEGAPKMLVEALKHYGQLELVGKGSNPNITKWAKEVGSFVLFIDSIGLGVSTVAGTALALDLKLDPIPAILLGLLSAVLGGLTRDLLAQVPPVLLHRKTNGTASFIGASAFVIAIEAGANQEIASAIGFVLVIGIRLISIKQNWNLPKIKG